MRIFPENLATFEKKVVKKNGEEIFANLIQTLTSEAGIQGQCIICLSSTSLTSISVPFLLMLKVVSKKLNKGS